ncbi:MAG TPA: DUF1800 family protein [Kiritimatiellia bacterium]|nr:DUF1800 family protein [Kiritimatiellia bacterium]
MQKAIIHGIVACLLHAGGWTLAQIDHRGSGMSDVWEAAYGIGLDPHADPDGDCFTNLEESIAGTNPHDPLCHPRATLISLQPPNRAEVRFSTMPGIHYHLETSADFIEWLPVGQPVIGDGTPHNSMIEFDQTFILGGVSHSVWTGLTGHGVGLIKNYVSNSVPPSITGTLHRLDLPRSDPNQDQFGQYIRGWLLPPETGDYTLWIASDDQGELWLSPSSDPAAKQLIAGVPGWSGYREWNKYPEQQSTPRNFTAGQSYYFEAYQRESYGGDHLSIAWTLPGRALNEREIIASPHLSLTGQSLAELSLQGGLNFRIRIEQPDSDGDGVTDYEERLLGLNPTTPATVPRQPDLSAALNILASPNTLTIGVTQPRAYEAEGHPAQFTLFRAGGISPVTVAYEVSGTATPGLDFLPLPGTISFPPGARSITIDIIPLPDDLLEPPETVTLTLLPGTNYLLGTPAQATITIDDSMDVLYVAQLRSAEGIEGGGTGIAAIRRTGNALASKVNLSYSGLTAEPLAAEIAASSLNGIGGINVLDLPTVQTVQLDWSFEPTNSLPRETILDALDAETLWVRIRTASHPSGELLGRLVRTPGWDAMPEPAPPPPAPTAPSDLGEASRFLAQATFGPTLTDLQSLATNTFPQWIEHQLSLPPTHHLPYVQHRRAELYARNGSDGWQTPRQEAWWQHAITAPDQLRQRVAFALSQILVISQFGPLDGAHEGTTLYYDMLLDHAFGNFRNLIEDVTLSPMMGTYLSMMRNQKPNPETGHEPDENYAREIMQLFTVGLVELHNDGSLRLDADGMPIPTYTQDDTVALAHIFTGWSAHYDPDHPPTWWNGNTADRIGWFYWGWDEMRPMTFYPEFHDTQPRTILRNTLIPAGSNGQQRLALALDTLFNHPNTGPFIARQLIQRLVTSNPGPGYIHRVASVFNDNGHGIRGDLAATVRAILLDPEARHPSFRESISYGKPIEPVLRISRMIRAFLPAPPFADQNDPRLFLNYQWSLPEQAPLYSPSVFNFFQPVYRHPGPITRAGLLSPEFQIFHETTAIRQANIHYSSLNWGIWTPEPLGGTNGNAVLRLDFNPQLAILQHSEFTPAQAQHALLDHLDQLLLLGSMTPTLRAELQTAFDSLPSWFGYTTDRQLQRIQLAAYLILNSPEFFVQR